MAYLSSGDVRVPVKGILFDKDGTLLDFNFMWGLWSQQLIERLKPYAEGVDWGRAMGLIIEGDNVEFDPFGPMAMASNVHIEGILAWHLYLKDIPWNKAIQIVDQEVHHTNIAMQSIRPVRPLNGLIPFLQQCREAGVLVGVATADVTPIAEQHVEWLGIKDHFSAIVGSDQVRRGKPHPEMALLACGQMGLKPEDVIMIGDTYADIELGYNARMRATVQVGVEDVSSTQRTGQVIPDIRVKDYTQLSIGKDEGAAG